MRIDPLLTRSPETGAIRHVTDSLLAETYLSPRAPDLRLSEHLSDPTAPWSRSFDAAPTETSRAVEAALSMVASSTSRLDPDEINPSLLPSSRARTHLEALKDLWSGIGVAQGPLNIWAHVLRSPSMAALEALPLLDPTPCAFATPAETALAATLLAHHGTAPEAALNDWRARQPVMHTTGDTALQKVQRHLGQWTEAIPLDDTIACYGLRDPREESDFAAALARRMLDDGTVSSVGELGVLAPDDPAYDAALGDAFDRVGLPLSGQPATALERDITSELLGLLLVVLEGPAPRTAIASLCVSPLMPWPRAIGNLMARRVIERGWSRAASDLTGAAREVWDALRPCETPDQLFARLGAIARAAPDAGLRPRIAALRAVTQETIDWPLLRRIVAISPVSAPVGDRIVEGVSLFTEAALPWRGARQLIVLGMAGRSWPRQPGTDPFFTEAEIAQIRTTGLALPGRREKLARGLELLRRQLGAATDGLTLLVPAMDLRGDRQSPSVGLALITHMLGFEEPVDFVRDIRAEDISTWPVAAQRLEAEPTSGHPILPSDGHLHLNRGLGTPDRPGLDLLLLRQDASGAMRPQSPSRLETLLVSPLAWVLEELDAKDRTWAPETLDVMTLGNILHQVLEDGFPEGAPAPEADRLLAAIPEILDNAIQRHAPWLAGPQWATERRSLLREANEVAAGWNDFLTATGAEVLHNEIALSGDHGGLLLQGRADCLLRLPDGRILVVDHKRSRASGRRDRMAKGWDLQVALYRAMLERPAAETALTRLVAEGAEVVTAYHTMLDSTVLSDAAGAEIPRTEAVSADASVNAMDHLARVVAEVAAGTIRLNRAGDAKAFKDRGISAYALDGNTLVAAFTLPDEEEDA